MTKTWLIYALGGGWGHLTRALSLGRIVATHTKVRIITNSPYAQQIGHEGCIIHWIPNYFGFSATCKQVREILHNTHYDRLIIDTFPRGLGGELADILPKLHHLPRVLIHRDINPRYVITKGLRSFVQKNFDLVIVPGEGEDLPLCDLSIVQYTAPWLIRNAWELPDRMTVRSHIFRVNEFIKIILVCATGQASELHTFGQIAMHLHQTFPKCAVRVLAANCPENCSKALWVSYQPGIECLAAADVVVGAAGYNTVYECASVGVPLVALAFPRLYDRQAKRASKAYYAKDIDEAIATVSIILDQIKPGNKPFTPSYINGAVQAVDNYLSELS